MARIGSRVRPELGTADFSGFTRAAEIRAGTLQNLTGDLVEGVQQYQSNKTQLSNTIAENEAIIQNNPQLFKDISADPNTPKSVSKALQQQEAGQFSLNNASVINTYLRSTQAEQARQRNVELNALQLSNVRAQQADRQKVEEERKIAQSLLQTSIRKARTAENKGGDPFVFNESFINDSIAKAVEFGVRPSIAKSAIDPFVQRKAEETSGRTAEAEATVAEAGAGSAEERVQLENESLRLDNELKKLEGQELYVGLTLGTNVIDNAGFEKADEKIQESLAEYFTTGKAKSEEGIATLENVIRTIAENPELGFRSVASFIPEGALGEEFTNLFKPDLGDVRDRIRGIAYQTLRETLGAQFTQREGERLVNTYFNPQLSDAQNIQRLNDFLVRLKEVKRAQEEVYDYYRGNSTIKGFEPTSSRGIRAVSDLIDDVERVGARNISAQGTRGANKITFTAIEE